MARTGNTPYDFLRKHGAKTSEELKAEQKQPPESSLPNQAKLKKKNLCGGKGGFYHRLIFPGPDRKESVFRRVYSLGNIELHKQSLCRNSF